MLWDKGAPPGWERRISASKGKAYYVHKETGKTTWVHPLAPEKEVARRRSLAIASVDDAPAVPATLIEQIGDGMFPVMMRAGTPALAVVRVRVPPGFVGAGRLVTVIVPAGVPTDCCFWIVAPLPKSVAPDREGSFHRRCSVDISDAWSSAGGSAASTVPNDSASVSALTEQDLDELDDCEEDWRDFDKHEYNEQEVRAAAHALALARSLSPDYTALAPEDPAAPAILISRTPSPPALASPGGEIPPRPAEKAEKAENPFRKQLHLLRCTESHHGALMSTASLPAGWEKKMSASRGKPYYFNKFTGETTWVLPQDQETNIRLQAERSEVWQLMEIRAHHLGLKSPR
jgi:hypothetical protein